MITRRRAFVLSWLPSFLVAAPFWVFGLFVVLVTGAFALYASKFLRTTREAVALGVGTALFAGVWAYVFFVAGVGLTGGFD